MGELPEQTAELARLARAARRTGLRLRLDDTLAEAGTLLLLPLLVAISALTYIKVRRPPVETERALLWFFLVSVLLIVARLARVWFRSRPLEAGALALDRHYGLQSRVSSALAFAKMPRDQRSPMMELSIRDALRLAHGVEPRRAVALHVPPEWPIVLLLAAGLAGVALLEVQTTRTLPPGRHFEPLVMSGDDLELFRDIATELEQTSRDPEARSAVGRFNQLIEDIAQRRLDRREIFERLERLERELMQGAEADREALEQGMRSLARELEKSDLSRPIAQQLQEQRLADAEKAMRELAEKLRKKQGAPNKAELEKLRQALAQASRTHAEASKRAEQRRRELEEQKKALLKKQTPDGGLAEKDRSLLRKKERELERLERERQQAARAERQLSKLDRELGQAAEDLMKELGAGANDLDQGADDLNRMAKQEMTEQEKEQLRQRLRELRELVRQQGQGGKDRLQRLVRFGQRARGKSGQEGSGQEQSGSGQGQGKKGQGRGQSAEVFTPGAGKDLLILPGGQRETTASASAQSGQSGAQSGAGENSSGAQEGGRNWGTGHDPNLAGKPTGLKSATKDVTAVAADTGQGTASSEVIYGAAQRGFVGRGYQKVYTDYRTVAEQVLNQDQIPPGYRFYVQRYFQLIRPRE